MQAVLPTSAVSIRDRLPASLPAGSHCGPSPAGGISAANATDRSRILVAEADPGTRMLLTEILRLDGHAVTAADSAAQIVAQIEAEAVDLLVIDLVRFGEDDHALMRRLRQLEWRVPFIVLVARGNEKAAVENLNHGAIDYVMKDMSLVDLLPQVVRLALANIRREKILRRTLQELGESEARFTAAASATNDGVWELWLPEKRVFFSDRWKAIAGHEPDGIAPEFSEWLKRIHPEDWDRFGRGFQDLVAGRSALFNFEHRLRHSDESYRWVLARALLLHDTEGRPLRICGALTDVTERKKLEGEILRISDREQWRLGQDLHDGLGQQLTAIEMMGQSLKEKLAGAREELAADASRLCACLRDAIKQTRALAHELTPFLVASAGLAEALVELTARIDSLGPVRCRCEVSGEISVAHNEAELHLFRIAQEAICNAIRHARARNITVRLSCTDNGGLCLEVADDGDGFPAQKEGMATGMGMQVMLYRANTIGAEFQVHSRAGAGVTVRCGLGPRGTNDGWA